MPHSSTDALILRAENFFTGKQNTQGKDHIDTCPTCFVESLDWSCLFESFRLAPLQSPPQHATRACLALFQPRQRRSLVREIMATIVFDSQTMEFAGVRGTTGARQLRLSAADTDIHLSVSANGKRILGQILETSSNNALPDVRVRLLQAEQAVAISATDELGEFMFDIEAVGDLTFQADLSSGCRLSGNFTTKETN